MPESEKVLFQYLLDKLKDRYLQLEFEYCFEGSRVTSLNVGLSFEHYVSRTMERTRLWTRLQWWENGVLWPSEKTLLKLLEFLYSRLYYHMFRIDCDVIPNQRMLFTRCALHGLIYLWDLKSTTKSLTEDTKKDKIIEKEARQKIGIKTRQILTQHNNTKISFR